MGWTAEATEFNPDNPEHVALFQKCARRAAQSCGSMDGHLEHGALHCSKCRIALHWLTITFSCTDLEWTPEAVRLLAKQAFDNVPAASLSEWPVQSALRFLLACAKLNSGIVFSW